MDTQTLIVLTLIVVAALYVARSLWPSRRSRTGCRSCPQNRDRADDYT
ncbi:MAG: FeoB-associated Cys-rich membrane protein [Deltaproteobacteria bacterium]|nr:FeoB-associated Cys-rich membrane protein [Deltaproteobacteria bacterium]